MKTNHTRVSEHLVSEKSYIITFLLLFLGYLGLHRLYVGRFYTATVMMSMSVLGLSRISRIEYFLLPMAFLWVHDCINVIFGLFTDEDHKFVIMKVPKF